SSEPGELALASVLQSVGSFWEAERWYRSVLKRTPSNQAALMGLADLAMSDGRYGEAAQHYYAVMKLTGGKDLGASLGLAECARLQSPKNSAEKERPLVSIVIPVWNELEFTRRCLAAIQKTTQQPYEIIVVNNGSTDGTTEYLNQLTGKVKVVNHPENVGFVQGCNSGAKEARGKYILLLNNDTEPQTGWLEALVETLEADETVGAVGAKLIYPNGKLQEAGGICFQDGTAWNFGKHDDPDKPEYSYLREACYCSAACLLVRRDLWEKIGGFDERYSPAYWEDTDLAFSIRNLGYRVMFQPRSKVVHHE